MSLMFLALLQGISEFLPISSSGHLVLAKVLLGVQESGATIEIFLHFGTLMAILVFYRKRIAAMLRPIFSGKFGDSNAKRLWLILWASVPAGIIGILWGSELEKLFAKTHLAAAMLILTAILLLSTLFARRKKLFRWNLLTSLVAGLAQAFAILPGISRSGATIAAALWLGAMPEDAAEFSFILAIPVLTGAAAFKARELVAAKTCPEPALWLATIVAAVVGYAVLSVLIPILKKGKFWVFGIYCMIVGIVGLIMLP